jgi:hypothetical protein
MLVCYWPGFGNQPWKPTKALNQPASLNNSAARRDRRNPDHVTAPTSQISVLSVPSVAKIPAASQVL